MLLHLLERLDRGLRLLLEGMAISLLSALALICFVEVVLRYGFGRSLAWYDEFSGYLLVWLSFLGSALAQREERHIGVVEVGGETAPGGRRRAKLAVHTVLLAVQGVLLYYGARLAFRFRDEPAITLPVPMGLLYTVIPLSALLIILLQITQVARLLQPRERSVSDRQSTP